MRRRCLAPYCFARAGHHDAALLSKESLASYRVRSRDVDVGSLICVEGCQHWQGRQWRCNWRGTAARQCPDTYQPQPKSMRRAAANSTPSSCLSPPTSSSSPTSLPRLVPSDRGRQIIGRRRHRLTHRYTARAPREQRRLHCPTTGRSHSDRRSGIRHEPVATWNGAPVLAPPARPERPLPASTRRATVATLLHRPRASRCQPTFRRPFCPHPTIRRQFGTIRVAVLLSTSWPRSLCFDLAPPSAPNAQ